MLYYFLKKNFSFLLIFSIFSYFFASKKPTGTLWAAKSFLLVLVLLLSKFLVLQLRNNMLQRASSRNVLTANSMPHPLEHQASDGAHRAHRSSHHCPEQDLLGDRILNKNVRPLQRRQMSIFAINKNSSRESPQSRSQRQNNNTVASGAQRQVAPEASLKVEPLQRGESSDIMQILSTIYLSSETAVSLIVATPPIVPAELLRQNGASEEQIEAVGQEIARSVLFQSWSGVLALKLRL